MTPATLWIVIAVVAAVVLVALVAGLVLYRRRRISLREAEQVGSGTDTAIAPPRKGNEYKAGGDFSFTAGSDAPAAPPVRTPEPERAVPAPEVAPETAPEIPTETVAEPVAPVEAPAPAVEPAAPPVTPSPNGFVTATPTEEIAPAEGRMERLRGQLARSRSGFGQSLLGLLGAGELDEDSWSTSRRPCSPPTSAPR